MAVYIWPIPANLQPKVSNDTVGAVNEFLTSQGFTAAGRNDLEVTLTNDPLALVIVADSDPRPALATYTGTSSAKRDQLVKARTVALNFRDKVMANPSAFTENDRATAAAITLITRLAQTD